MLPIFLSGGCSAFLMSRWIVTFSVYGLLEHLRAGCHTVSTILEELVVTYLCDTLEYCFAVPASFT